MKKSVVATSHAQNRTWGIWYNESGLEDFFFSSFE